MKILNFEGFSALYEAADQNLSDETKSLIRRIVTSFGASYGSMAALAGEYKDVMKDLDTVLQANDDEKVAKLKEISDKVNGAMDKAYKDGGVDVAWKAAADKTIEAIETLIKQYEGEEETLKAVYADVLDFMTGYKDQLVKAKQEATKVEAAVKESEVVALNEGMFTTKKGNAKSLMKQAVTLKAELEAAAEDPGLVSFVSGKVTQVKDFIQRLAEMQSAKRKDIKEEELAEIGETLDKIPQELNSKIESLAKANKANKEAAMIYVKAIDLIDDAINKEMEITKKLQELAAEEAKEAELASRLSISGDLDPDKISSRRVNSDVQKFQELVIKTFKDYGPFEDFDLYQKFERYGADGKFGPTTKSLVVALKAGYGLEDDTDIITQELITKMYEEPLDESNRSYIRGFETFQKGSLLEAFDPNKAKSAAPAPRSGGSGTETKKEEAKEDSWDNYPCVTSHPDAKEDTWQDGSKFYVIGGKNFFANGRRSNDDNTGMVSYSCDDEMFKTYTQNEIDSAVSEIENLYIDGCKAIEALYDDTSYWKEYKGTFNDDEDVAVRDTFGSEYSSTGTWWKNTLRNRYVTKAWNLYHGDGKYAWLKTEAPDTFSKLEGISNKFKTIYSNLKRKTYGGTSDDDYVWSITTVGGKKYTFEVDTDF